MALLTAQMAHALREGFPRGLFVAIEHPSGTGYFWTGLGSRTWNGHTWNGTGVLGKVSPIKQSSEIAIQDIVFSLSGVDASIVAGLSDDVRNRAGTVWLACLAADDTVVPDPYQIVNSSLDFQSFNVDPDGTSTIEVTAHSGFYTLDRGVDEAWTPENQRLTYPLDTGLDQIPILQNQDLKWTAS